MSIKAKKNIASSELVEEVYYPKDIPDTSVELIKKAEKARIRQRKEALAERSHRQDLKQQRILAAKEDKFRHAIDLIIERAQYQNSTSFSIDFYDFNFEDTMDNLRVLLGFLDSLIASNCFKSYTKTNYSGGTRLYFNDINIKRLRLHRDGLSKSTSVHNDPSEYLITVKDREIWVNNYIIAKPHAVGSNHDFFEYIRSQPANKQIKRENLSIELQEGLGHKNFFKILNALGFKGEIRKAFFYKVDALTLYYRGDQVTSQQLIDAGVKLKLFIKELEAADAKHNPI